MSYLIFIAATVLVVVLLGLKWNNMRTKLAFLFIFLGVLFIFSLIFLVFSDNANISQVTDFFTSIKVYFLWIKSALGDVFEVTGKIINFEWVKG